MGLLAQLCYKLHPVPEVLATEALALLLREATLGDALGKFIAAQLGGLREIPSRLEFKTQVSADDKGRPDIVATGADGRPSLILELKFWAALTANQPVTYLDRLSESGALVFIAPAIRHVPLWSELTRRVVDARRQVEIIARSADDLQVASVAGVPMVLVSWRRVLAVLSDAASGDAARSSDIRQLYDLAETMDSEAFLPLRPDELSPEIGRRWYQFAEIIPDVVSALLEDGTCSRKAKVSSGLGWTGIAVLIKNHWLYVEVSSWHWGHYADTPFWLVYYGGPKHWPALDVALDDLTREVPPRLLKRSDGGSPMMPLHVPIGAERHTVVAALCDQIRDIAKRVPAAASAAPEPEAPPAEGPA